MSVCSVNCSSAWQPRTTHQSSGDWVCIFAFSHRVPTKKPQGSHRQQCMLPAWGPPLYFPLQSLLSKGFEKEIRSLSEAWIPPECFQSLLDLWLWLYECCLLRDQPNCHQPQSQPHSGIWNLSGLFHLGPSRCGFRKRWWMYLLVLSHLRHLKVFIFRS